MTRSGNFLIKIGKHVMTRNGKFFDKNSKTIQTCNSDDFHESFKLSMKAEKKGIMFGSMFEESHLSFTQIVGILHHFAKQTSLVKAAVSLELHKATVCKWYKALREDICSWWLQQPGNAFRLGGIVNGQRRIVEIDESCVNREVFNTPFIIFFIMKCCNFS